MAADIKNYSKKSTFYSEKWEGLIWKRVTAKTIDWYFNKKPIDKLIKIIKVKNKLFLQNYILNKNFYFSLIIEFRNNLKFI